MIEKITNAITPLKHVDKINEVIDKFNDFYKRQVGEILPIVASDNYVPDGTLPCDGAEYTKSQFSDLWDNYFISDNYITIATPSNFISVDGFNLTKDGQLSGFSESNYLSFDLSDLTDGDQPNLVFTISATDVITKQILAQGKDSPTSSEVDELRIENGYFVYKDIDGVETNVCEAVAGRKYKLRFTENNLGYYDCQIWNNDSSIDGAFLGGVLPLVSGNDYIFEFGHTFTSGTLYLLESFYNYYSSEDIYFATGTQVTIGLLNTCTYSDYEADIATYGQCSKFAVDVDNETFRVPLIPQPKRYLIDKKEPTDADPSWYNLYSDGWLEQGGTGIGGKNTTGAFQEFIKPYRDSNVTVTAIVDRSDKGNLDNGASNTIKIVNVSADGFYQGTSYVGAATGEFKSYPFRWRACGYCNTVVEDILRYFVVVANGQTNQSMMDWSAWASSLQGKMNVDHSNDTKPYIVEVSDKSLMPSWYRVWSDGWCEQGGQIEGTSDITVTLLKPYNDTSYSVLANGINVSGTGTITTKFFGASSITNSSFVLNTSTSLGEQVWEAKGYIS